MPQDHQHPNRHFAGRFVGISVRRFANPWGFLLAAVIVGHWVLGSPASFAGVGTSDAWAKLRLLRNENKTNEATQFAQTQVSQSQDPVETANWNLALGSLREAAGLRKEAVQSYNEVLNAPSNARQPLIEVAHWQLANLLLPVDETGAVEHFQALLQLQPNARMKMQTQFELAKIDITHKRYREALMFLNQLEKRNRHEEFYPNLIFQLARAERGQHNSKNFCKWTRKLYSRFPDYPAIQDWGLNLSENVFDAAPTSCPSSFEDHKTRIRNLQWAGLTAKAKQEIDLLLQSSQANEANALLVNYFLHEGDIDQAMAILKPQYSSRRRDPKYLLMVANATAKMGDMPAAVGSYYAAFKVSPRGKMARQALYQAAFVSYQYQDYDGAARKFQEFTKVFPNSGLSKDAQWHLSWIRYLRGDYEGALESLQRLSQQTHKSRRPSRTALDRIEYWTAMTLWRLKRQTEARVVLQRLSQDRTLGYYAFAAQSRLHQLKEILPDFSYHAVADEKQHFSRYETSPALLPSDDPTWWSAMQDKGKGAGEGEDLKSDSSTAPTQVAAAEEAESEQDVLAPESSRDSSADATSDAADSDASGEEAPMPTPELERRFARALRLANDGFLEWARWDLFEVEKRTRSREALKTLIEHYEAIESYNRSSYLAQVNFGNMRSTLGVEGAHAMWEHAFPHAYAPFVSKYSKDFGVPAEFIWGIMRSESQYKRDVVSPVGALGLMQVMPGTALKVARLLGDKDFIPHTLIQPEIAIRIGSKYLQRMMNQFQGNLPLVAAAYNAGPHRVRSWLASFGELDTDEFIEHIPYLETRNYVKKVLMYDLIYQRLAGGTQPPANGSAAKLSFAEPLKIQINEPLLAKENWDDL